MIKYFFLFSLRNRFNSQIVYLLRILEADVGHDIYRQVILIDNIQTDH